MLFWIHLVEGEFIFSFAYINIYHLFMQHFVDVSTAYALLSVIGKRVCTAELGLLVFRISLITNAWVDILR